MREEIKELVATAVYTSSPQYPELDNRAANYKNIKYTTDQILTLLDKEIRKARLDEMNRMLEKLKSGEWKSFATEVTDRIKQLENRNEEE